MVRLKALDVSGVSKSYGSLKALDDVSFSINPGEMYALLGPNGSGKTTLISIISTLLRGDSGSIKVFGNEVGPEQYDTKALIGLVPQEIINHGFFKVHEILRFVSGYYGLYDNQKRCDYLLDNLGLTEHRDKLVRELSGGMKRRLLIAKALVHSPKLLLLDEPTAGVDIELRNSMWAFVRELNEKEGMTIMLTTHYLEEAEELCDRLAIISRGKLLEEGGTKELISKRTNRQVVIKTNTEVDCSSPYLLKKEENSLLFQIPNKMNLGGLLKELDMDRAVIEDIFIKEGSLEEAFLDVVSTSAKGGL